MQKKNKKIMENYLLKIITNILQKKVRKIMMGKNSTIKSPMRTSCRLKKGRLSLKGELSMMANGQEASNMGMECKCGPMEPNTKECGPKAKHLVKANSPMSLEIHTKDSGKMTKPMAMVSVSMRKVERDIKGIGNEICSMGQVLKFILMGIGLKGCSNRERRVEKVLIIYLMEQYIKGSGLMVELKAKALVNGRMEGSM
jgi:hypothetical protein